MAKRKLDVDKLWDDEIQATEEKISKADKEKIPPPKEKPLPKTYDQLKKEAEEAGTSKTKPEFKSFPIK